MKNVQKWKSFSHDPLTGNLILPIFHFFHFFQHNFTFGLRQKLENITESSNDNKSVEALKS